MSSPWLPITDYSSKYKVSVSTLRRRIKANDIKYQFSDGKYLLLDEPVTTHQQHRPSQVSEAVVGLKFQPEIPAEMQLSSLQQEGPILTVANKLLNELKKAYTQVLQEKEEQILHLKEEVTDLKTLVRVLESENDRLNDRIV